MLRKPAQKLAGAAIGIGAVALLAAWANNRGEQKPRVTEPRPSSWVMATQPSAFLPSPTPAQQVEFSIPLPSSLETHEPLTLLRVPRNLWGSFDQMHEAYLTLFATNPGFGSSRVLQVPRFYEPGVIPFNGRLHEVGVIELISLADENSTSSGKKPIVHFSVDGKPLTKGNLKGAGKRLLREDEERAIQKLLKGGDSAVVGDADHPLVVGALRATSGCLRCHEGKQGDLMGAFTYPLTPAFRAFELAPLPPPQFSRDYSSTILLSPGSGSAKLNKNPTR